jgi:hypothetical protein
MYIVQESGNNFEVLKQTKVSVNQKVTCRLKTLKYICITFAIAGKERIF